MRKNLKKLVQAGSAVVVFAGLTAGSIAPAQAAKLDDPWGHFFSCMELMFEDPDEHEKTCLVNRRNPNINPGVANQIPPQPMKMYGHWKHGGGDKKFYRGGGEGPRRIGGRRRGGPRRGGPSVNLQVQ